MYSNLSPSMISPQTMHELVLANKLNLVSTDKLRYSADILKSKKYTEEAAWLAKQVGISLQVRRENTSNTYNNAQNVHLTSIQDTMQANIRYIINYVPNTPTILQKDNFIAHLRHELDLDINTYHAMYKMLDNRHSTYQATYFDVLYKVYYICNDSPSRTDLLNVLKNEIKDGINTCLTGQITRLVNTLVGYDSNIKLSISKNEEMANSILALRKKYAIMYQDAYDYITELTPQVMQLLEDMCVSEVEQAAWLEYI
jgi:hypothetical protein